MAGFKYKVVRFLPEVEDQNKSQEERAPVSDEQLEQLLNEMAADGWEFCRVETILRRWIATHTSNTLGSTRNVVIFRRPA